MTFIQNHQPKSVDDLIFKDSRVERIVRDYADGKATKHLILHGPVGSGKSSAAKMIVAQQCGQPFDQLANITINGRIDVDRKDWADVQSDWNLQRITNSSGHAYTIIDEVDACNKKLIGQLDALIETDRIGTVIMTTNNLHNLPDWLRDRCRVVDVKRPNAQDVQQRVQEILRAEGCDDSLATVQTLFTNFDGSLRQMIDWIEEYVRSSAHPKESAAGRSRWVILPNSPKTSIKGAST